MKKIEINGHIFFYSIELEVDGGGCAYQWTEFFLKTKTVTRRRFWIFGRWETYDIGDPNSHVFTINFAINDKRYTKIEVRNAIEHQVKLWKRPAEIERGEII